MGEAALLVGLVPNGLFVSIAIAYALGAVRIVRFGALVQQANAIESLSHVDVLCLDKTGTLTSNRLSVEEVVPLDGTEAGLRALLGDVVASAAVRNKTAEAIAAAYPGTALPLARDVPFSSARKWSAVAFGPAAGPDRTGVVAMGAAESLRPALGGGIGDTAAWAELRSRIEPSTGRGLRVLVVASHPDPGGLAGGDDAPTLPAGMRPLGLVVLNDELRPDAAATLARFVAAGVTPKVISGDDPETVVALARQAGLGPDLRSIAGPELDGMDDEQLAAVALATTVFGRITPAQKERLVDALRSRGRYVAMIGDGVNDVLSLKKANLGIAMQSGSQAARGVADIVLTNDSFASLAPAVEEGQRIRNGMQDILRLFLSRITTVGLLVVTSLVLGIFPIELRNSSVLTLFTVGIPTAFLAVWAQPGARAQESLGRTLARFVVPAAVLSSLAGLAVLFGVIVFRLGGIDALAGRGTVEPAALDAAILVGQSALTSFLVFAGLVLVVFVEPPVAWLAVIEPRSPDWRPTILAAAARGALPCAAGGAGGAHPLRPPATRRPRARDRRGGGRRLGGGVARGVAVSGRGAIPGDLNGEGRRAGSAWRPSRRVGRLFHRLPEQRPEPFRLRPPRIAQIQLVVPPARPQARGGDRGVEPLDRGPLLLVRPEVEDLGDRAFLEALDPEIGSELDGQLRATAGKRGRELLLRGLGREGDEERPAPPPPVWPQDRVEVRRFVGRPVQALQQPDPHRHAAPLQREVEPVRGRVEARHPGSEGRLAGLALAVDHDGPDRRDVKEPDLAGSTPELGVAIGGALADDGGHQTCSVAQPKRRQDLRAERFDELGLVAADVVEVDLVEAHLDVVLEACRVDLEVRRDQDAVAEVLRPHQLRHRREVLRVPDVLLREGHPPVRPLAHRVGERLIFGGRPADVDLEELGHPRRGPCRPRGRPRRTCPRASRSSRRPRPR